MGASVSKKTAVIGGVVGGALMWFAAGVIFTVSTPVIIGAVVVGVVVGAIVGAAAGGTIDRAG